MTIATSTQETPAFIASGDNEIFGILTAPTVKPNGAAVIMSFGGLSTLSVNRNRFTVTTARRLAALGYHVLRIDLHGVGESTGFVEANDLARPFFQDVIAGAEWLRGRGLHDVVLAGQCYGARTCLAAAEYLTGLQGIALFSMPTVDTANATYARGVAKKRVRWLVRSAMRPRMVREILRRRHRRISTRVFVRTFLRAIRGLGDGNTHPSVSRDVRHQLQHLVDQGTPTLIVHGNDEVGKDFTSSRGGTIDPIVDATGARIEVLSVATSMHGLLSLESQRVAGTLLEEWLTSLSIAKSARQKAESIPR
jgi:pimeloyl-ACP methyl ester carboxylesterase